MAMHGFSDDRIGSLPDDILLRILSFLPSTKEVVATSILSRRWRYLHCKSDVINLDSQMISAVNRNKLMALRGGTPIRKLLINNNDYGICLDINPWIEDALCQGLQELDVFSYFHNVPLPDSLWNHKQLATLKLVKVKLHATKYPEGVCLPRLRSLCLERIYIEADFINAIFAKSPLLENVAFFDCIWEEEVVHNLSSKALKSLNLNNCHPSHRWTRVMIDAPGLMYLQFYSRLFFDYTFKNFSSLAKADIVLDTDGNFEEHLDYIPNLISGVARVKVLRISCSSLIRPLPERANSSGLRFELPIFSNLSRLEFGYLGQWGLWNILPALMDRSPCLEDLVFLCGLEDVNGHPKKELDSFSSNLERIELCSFYGHEAEFEMIEYLLQNAGSLKKLVVRDHRNLSIESKLQINKELRMLKRSSRHCSIDYI